MLRLCPRASNSPVEAGSGESDWREANPACRIWNCRDWTDQKTVGFLVTEEGDPDRPLAFIPLDSTKPTRDDENDAYGEAELLANDRWRFGHCRRPMVDLRHYLRPDNDEAVPGFIYGLLVRPVEDLDGECDTTVRPVEPCPRCPVRLAKMQSRRR